MATAISRSSQADLLDELAAQNQELITTLDQLNNQRIELEKINDELGETNRGVVALYDELDTVQRVGRVVRASSILPRCSKRLLMPQLRLVAPNVAGSFARSRRVRILLVKPSADRSA
jgi:hypothetical protein